MEQILFWAYIINGTLFVLQELESAYWKQWELLRIPDGNKLFLTVHIPVVFLLLMGVIPVYRVEAPGILASFLLAGGGITTFFIQLLFLKKGHRELMNTMSLTILGLLLVVSTLEFSVTLYLALRM